MNKIPPRHQTLFSVISLFASVVLCSSQGYAADLGDIYSPLIGSNKFLYKAEMYSFDMSEEGTHGSASFGAFNSDPKLFSLSHSLRFSPIANMEIETGYRQFLPQEYTRYTYDGPTSALDTVQDHRLDHFQDYSLQLRFRKALFETYLSVQEKRQKAKTDAKLLLDDTISFDDIYSHFEDFKFGVRYLSKEKASSGKDHYFQVTRPQLEADQVNVEANLGYKNGKVKNSQDVYSRGALYFREYSHQLRPHVIPEVLLRYGVSDRVNVETGFSYTTPFKYKYECRRFNPTNTNFIIGTYNIKNNLEAPLKVSYRPWDHFSVTASSDFRFTRQRLDLWEKKTDGSTAVYTVRKLRAYNAKPTLELAYFHDAGQPVTENEFSSLTVQMLRQKQLLLSFQYQKDMTSLKKADNNGAQNVIDPYGLFMDPLDLFVSGTEEAVFFLGDKTTQAAGVQSQNFYLLKTKLIYGIRDFLNAGIEAGYRSGSSLHHFTVHDVFDRFYQFEPYYYFNFLADWKVKENSLLSLRAHYVPQYKTFLNTTGHPKQFEAETQYYSISLAWKILF
ncbi:MAG: hypothetical protein JW847_01820 [Candidatus Omnitrophica bacterium]|nr:hypothetical protein [Candidatus Omnitrophota bacterium]